MLKVKKIQKKEGERPTDFLEKFFRVAPATYEVDGTLQCKGGKCRSYDDVKRVFDYYYPDTEEHVLIGSLKMLIKRHAINAVACPDIKKITFFPYDRYHYTYNPIFIALGTILVFNNHNRVCDYTGYNMKLDGWYIEPVKEILKRFGVKIPSEVTNIEDADN